MDGSCGAMCGCVFWLSLRGVSYWATMDGDGDGDSKTMGKGWIGGSLTP